MTQQGDILKVALLCSRGGHLQEMMDLEPAWSKYDHFFVTYDSERTHDMPIKKYLVYPPWESMIRFLWTLFIAIGRVFGERPDVLISAGMGWVDIFMFPFCKLLGVYTIYIESAANVNSISGTGKLVRKFADEFMVQWEELAEKIGADYHGGIL